MWSGRAGSSAESGPEQIALHTADTDSEVVLANQEEAGQEAELGRAGLEAGQRAAVL